MKRYINIFGLSTGKKKHLFLDFGLLYDKQLVGIFIRVNISPGNQVTIAEAASLGVNVFVDGDDNEETDGLVINGNHLFTYYEFIVHLLCFLYA